MTSTKTPHPTVPYTEWIEVSRVSEVGGWCNWTAGCPCCTCEEEGVLRITFTRNVWSRSSRAWREETIVETLCPEHVSEPLH